MIDKKIEKYKKLFTRALLILCIPVTFVMVYFSFRYSQGVRQIAYGNEVYVNRDNIFLHILMALLFVLLFFGYRKLPQGLKSERTCKMFLGIAMAVTALFCFLWIWNGNFYAMNDSRTVLECMEHIRNKDYSDLLPWGYLGAYRQ